MKRLLCLVLSILLFISPIYASTTGSNSPGYERNESNNYGVNKKITIDDSIINIIKNTPYVDASKKIYDFANILDSDDEKELSSLINGFINTTGLDFVFVSIDMPYSDDMDNDNYGYNFYDYNDFGMNMEKYGGIVLLRNTYSSAPYYTAVLTGEAQLYCDGYELDNLMDSLSSYFPNKLYKEGISKFLHSFTSLYEEGYDEEKYYIDDDGFVAEHKTLNFLPSIISGGLVSLLSMLGLVSKNKMVKKASNASNYLLNNSVNFINKNDKLVSTITTHHRISSDQGGGGSHSSFGSSGIGHTSSGRHG